MCPVSKVLFPLDCRIALSLPFRMKLNLRKDADPKIVDRFLAAKTPR